jgi:ribonucleoside-diphosphate reductase alpha chain
MITTNMEKAMTESVREKALRETNEYFEGDELAPDVFMKYALRDTAGNLLETNPDQMHRRLAKEFARIESKYKNPMSEDEIYHLLKDFKDVVPQGSPMSGIGNPYQLQSLSNCFVIDQPHDSYGGILFSDQEQVQIMKRRGGVGFDVSTIRPKGQPTTNAARTTDGIGIFMERFSNSTREVAQGGRRGALMLTIDCRHPEIETFIDIKRDLKKVTGANISVRFTDEFMKAIETNSDFVLRWPVESPIESAEICKIVNAKQIWDKFVDAAWTSAEPGALFWDTVVNQGIVDCYRDVGYKTISTNPCGEIALSPYDSCRLMVVNLTSFVTNPFTDNARFDFDRFNTVAIQAQRLMDDLVDLEVECVDRILAKIESDPQPAHVKKIESDLWHKIRAAGLNGRRTGLGITGLGDALASLNIQYGSDISIKVTEDIYKALAVAAHRSSLQLAKERGAFPVFDYEREKDHPYMMKVMTAVGGDALAAWKTTGRRNIALTTTAPVGSVSCLTRTTSGIEPAFLLSYKRRRKITQGDLTSRVDYVDPLGDKWQEYTVYHHWFKKWMDVTGKTDAKDSPYWGGTANDIDWVKSVDIQAAAQRWVDHSISKTCNLPSTASKETVNDVYLRAWASGCKGFTVYRDGCRTGVLVATDEPKKEAKKQDDRTAPKRPKSLSCDIHRANVRDASGESQPWLVLVGLLDGKPYEVFCGIPTSIEIPKKYKTGSIVKNGKRDGITTYNLHVPVDDENLVFKDIANLFDNPTQGAFSRTVSLALRHEVPIQYIVEQIQKDKNSDMFSFSKVVSRVLKGYIPDGAKTGGMTCYECGSKDLVYQEGCMTCASCGSSKCS